MSGGRSTVSEDIMNETHKSDASKKAPTIRAKSVESKRK